MPSSITSLFSAITQEVTFGSLVPAEVDDSTAEENTGPVAPNEYEPDEASVLNDLLLAGPDDGDLRRHSQILCQRTGSADDGDG